MARPSHPPRLDYSNYSRIPQIVFIISDSEFWVKKAQSTLSEKLGRKAITGQAKNVIMFLGDGFSIPTLAAARVYLGQSQGATGEETVLSFEEFPHTGLSKVRLTAIYMSKHTKNEHAHARLI
jgi:alkaline phosphatase